MKLRLLIVLSLMLMGLMLGGCVESADETNEPQNVVPEQSAEQITEPTEPTHPINLSDPDRFGPHLLVEAVTDKVYYAPGEQVEIEITMHNPMSCPVIVNPFPPKIEIWLQRLSTSNENQELILSLISEDNEIQFDADETKTYCFTWDQRDSDGNQVAPGQYYLVKTYYKAWKASGDGPIGGHEGVPTHILIQHSQGAMEKTIEVNQSQTVSDLTFMWGGKEIHTDVTMTLETVELLSVGTRFSVLCSSPYYWTMNPEEDWGRVGSPWDERVYTRFLIDGVIKYENLPKSTDFSEAGVRLVWGTNMNLDPVPSDAKELTFIVTSWGDWEGPWEFHVPLE